MNDSTRVTGSGPGYIPPQTGDDIPVDKTKGVPAQGALGSTQSSEVRTEQRDSSEGSRVSNKNGSPYISPPTSSFDPAEAAARIADLDSKSKQAQIKTQAGGLEFTRTQLESNLKQALSKIKEWQTNTENAIKEQAAAAKKEAQKSWFEKILSAIISIVVAIVVAPLALTGIGAPLAIAAVTWAMDSVMGCVNNARALEEPPQEALPMPYAAMTGGLSPGAWMMKEVLVGMGADEDAATEWGKILFTGLVIAMNPGYLLVNPSAVGESVGAMHKLTLLDDYEKALNATPPDKAEIQRLDNEIAKAAMIASITATILVAVATTVMTMGSGAAASIANVSAKVAATASNVSVMKAAVQVSMTFAKLAASLPQVTISLGKTAQMAMIIQAMASASASIVAADGRMEGAELRLTAAGSEKKASEAEAAQAILKARNMFLQNLFQDGGEQMKKLEQQLMEAAVNFSKNLNAVAELGTTVTDNMGAGFMKTA